MKKVDVLRSLTANRVASLFSYVANQSKKLVLFIQCLRTKI